jgi:hypothetical protein
MIENYEEILNSIDISKLNNNTISLIMSNINKLDNKVGLLSDTIINNKSELNNFFLLKVSDLKKDFTSDINSLLNGHTLDKTTPIIKELNNYLYDKINLLFNELVPKQNEKIIHEINSFIKNFQNSLNIDTNKILETTANKKSMDEFIRFIEDKFTQTLLNSQGIISSIVKSNDSQISELKEITLRNQNGQLHVHNNVIELLKKMENSSAKGKISENLLDNILQNLYPSAQIDMVANEKESGDFLIFRLDKPIILIENKNYTRNVNSIEVDKFIRDIDTQGCSGLFLSQKSGISGKQNFEINFHKGNILLFVHNVEYESEKIKIAIEIIDHMQRKLDECNNSLNNDNDTIDKNTLETINIELQNFINQKMIIIKSFKAMSQKIIKDLDDIRFPCFEMYINSRFSTATNSKFMCDKCSFIAKNQASLSAHKRACKSVGA